MSKLQIMQKITDESVQLYTHRFIYNLSLSSIALFLPVFLYDKGFSPTMIAAFFIATFMTALVAMYPISRLNNLLGFRKTAMISSPIILVLYFALRHLQITPEYLGMLALLKGFGSSIYWVSINSEMAKSSGGQNSDQKTGMFFSMPKIGAVISPFLGGAIISVAGFNALFGFAGAGMLISFIPLMKSSSKKPEKLKISDIYSFDKKYFLTFFFQGATSVGSIIILPLFMTLIITGSLGIGGIGSIMSLGGALFSSLLGKYSNSNNRHGIMKLGGTMFAGSWITMSFVATPLQAFIISFVNGMLVHTVSIPLYAKMVDVSHDNSTLEYFANREIGLLIGRIFALSIVGLLFLNLTIEEAVTAGFGLVALMVFPTVYYAMDIGN